MTKIKLGDVAFEYKGKLAGATKSVGLEHLSQGDVDLLGYDEGGDNTFTKAFKEGQVLFGRRRAYLKKASVAPFEGVCSGDIICIEAKEGLLSSRLLPFVIQNDNLFDFAVENSAGSLSPRVKWSSLAEYEFNLPDMRKQEELAELLWAAQELKRQYKKLLSANDEIVKSRFVEMFGGGEWPSKTIGELAIDIRYGTSKKASERGEYTYLRMNNMTDDGRLIYDDVKYIDLLEDELAKCQVADGDLLFNRTNSREKIGKTAVFHGNTPMVIAGYIIRVRLGEEMRPDYLSTFMNLPATKSMLRSVAKGAVHQANINSKELAAIKVPVAPIELQDRFLGFAEQVDKSGFSLFPLLLSARWFPELTSGSQMVPFQEKPFDVTIRNRRASV